MKRGYEAPRVCVGVGRSPKRRPLAPWSHLSGRAFVFGVICGRGGPGFHHVQEKARAQRAPAPSARPRPERPRRTGSVADCAGPSSWRAGARSCSARPWCSAACCSSPSSSPAGEAACTPGHRPGASSAGRAARGQVVGGSGFRGVKLETEFPCGFAGHFPVALAGHPAIWRGFRVQLGAP